MCQGRFCNSILGRDVIVNGSEATHDTTRLDEKRGIWMEGE